MPLDFFADSTATLLTTGDVYNATIHACTCAVGEDTFHAHCELDADFIIDNSESPLQQPYIPFDDIGVMQPETWTRLDKVLRKVRDNWSDARCKLAEDTAGLNVSVVKSFPATLRALRAILDQAKR